MSKTFFSLVFIFFLLSTKSDACFHFFKKKKNTPEVSLSFLEEEEANIIFSMFEKEHDINIEKRTIPIQETSEKIEFMGLNIKPKNKQLKESYWLSFSKNLEKPTSKWVLQIFLINPEKNSNHFIIKKFNDFIELFDNLDRRSLLTGGESVTRIESYSFSSQEYVDEVVHKEYGFFISGISLQEIKLNKNMTLEGPRENGVYASVEVEHESISMLSQFAYSVVGETSFFDMFH